MYDSQITNNNHSNLNLDFEPSEDRFIKSSDSSSDSDQELKMYLNI
jgi:hypothetical protein